MKLPAYIAKRFLGGVAFGLGVVGTIGAIWGVTISGTINSFTSGEVVSASKINQNFTSLRTALEGLPLGTYCGRTGNTNGQFSSGSSTDYQAAKALCATACGNTNAHMCTAHEMSMSLQNGVSVPTDSAMWVSSYLEAESGGFFVTDCLGWTSSGGSEFGSVMTTSKRAGKGVCSSAFPISCCL